MNGIFCWITAAAAAFAAARIYGDRDLFVGTSVFVGVQHRTWALHGVHAWRTSYVIERTNEQANSGRT